MPTGKIPFSSPVVKNTEEDFLNENTSSLINGYVSEAGVSIKWPGINLSYDLSSFVSSAGPVQGIFWWATQNKAVVVTSRKVFVLSFAYGSFSNVDVTNAVPSSGYITFAYDSTYFYLADGGKIMYSDGTVGSLADIADADSPTACTHVSYIDGYIIGNNSNQRFLYSNIEDGVTWDALDFASASGNPDRAIGQVVYDRKIFLFGSQSTEIWFNDGETPFSRMDGGFIERGCIAAGSILKTKIGVIWLDNERNLVVSNGGNPEVLSLEYQSVIDGFRVVSDCETSFLEYLGKQFIKIDFPSEDRTLLYCLTNKRWSELGDWNSDVSSFSRWKGNCILKANEWGITLVGDKSLPYIYTLSSSNYSYGTTTNRFLSRTGFLNYGSDSLKRSNRITIRIKRGFGDITESESPKLMFRCRANGSSIWSNTVEVDLGKAGDESHVIDVFSRGVFYTRQYELSCSADVPIAFLDAEEDYTVLR